MADSTLLWKLRAPNWLTVMMEPSAEPRVPSEHQDEIVQPFGINHSSMFIFLVSVIINYRGSRCAVQQIIHRPSRDLYLYLSLPGGG